MVLGQRRAAGGHHIFDAGAIEGQQVEVALDDDHLAGAADRLARAVHPVENAALVIDRRLGRVDVFRLPVAEGASAEGRHPAALAVDGKDQPAAEQVVVGAPVLAGADQPENAGSFGFDALPVEETRQRLPALRGVTQLEAGGDRSVVSPPLEITPGRFTLGRLHQDAVVEIGHRLINAVQRLAFAAASLRFGIGPLLLHHDADALAQGADCLREGEPFHLHEEGEGVAVLAAAEAVVALSGTVDAEGGRLLAVKRTQSEMIDAAALQADIRGDQLDHVCAVADLFDFVVRYASRHQPLNSTTVTFSPPCSGGAA